MSEQEMHALVKSLDAAGTNCINYNDFISAVLARKMTFERAQLWEAFRKLDVYKQNFLTRQSLQAVLKTREGVAADADIEQIFREVDLDGDGVISFDEFVVLMQRQVMIDKS